jgi:hypothetical protein
MCEMMGSCGDVRLMIKRKNTEKYRKIPKNTWSMKNTGIIRGEKYTRNKTRIKPTQF